MNVRKKINKVLSIVLPTLLGVAIVYYLFTKLDLNAIRQILSDDLNIRFVLLSMGIGILSHVVRAYRWRLQLWELNRTPKLSTMCNAIFATYSLNLLLPRLGEVWRSTYIARREKLPFTQVLGSIFADRFSDTVAAGLITVGVFLGQMSVFLGFLSKFPSIEQGVKSILTSPWLYLFLLSATITLTFFFRSKNERSWVLQVKQAVRNLWAGFATILRMQHKLAFLVCTFLLWFCYFLQLWVCFYAFEWSSNFTVLMALACFAMGSLSVAIPVQGGVGPWHLAVIATLTLYGVDENYAGAFAIVAHGCQFLLVILLGIYSAIAMAIESKKSPKADTTP